MPGTDAKKPRRSRAEPKLRAKKNPAEAGLGAAYSSKKMNKTAAIRPQHTA